MLSLLLGRCHHHAVINLQWLAVTQHLKRYPDMHEQCRVSHLVTLHIVVALYLQVVPYVEGETAYRTEFELDWFDKVRLLATWHCTNRTSDLSNDVCLN